MKRMVWTVPVLALLIVLLFCCGAAFAQGGRLSGAGTESNPYIIVDAEDWAAFADNVSAGVNTDRYYRLGADVSGITQPVGTEEHPFSGNFDGNGKKLTVNITEDYTKTGTAPFRYINGATIHDLTVEGSVTGGYHTAGLVGVVSGGTNTISRCTVSASVTGVMTTSRIGGIVGHGGTAELILADCVYNGTLIPQGIFSYAGGLQGWSDGNRLTITNCLFCGSWVNNTMSSLHPIAFHTSNAQTDATVNGAYYTLGPASAGSEYVPVQGTKVQTSPAETGISEICTVNGITVYRTVNTEVSGYRTYYVTGEDEIPGASDYTVTFDGTDVTGDSKYTAVLTRDGTTVSEVAGTGAYTLTLTGVPGAGYTGSYTYCFYVFSLHKDTEGRYVIANTEDWQAFAMTASEGRDYTGETVILTADISGATWTAGSSEHPFTGTFDGNGKTLNVSISDNSGQQGTAPFRCVSGAVIRDLTVTGTVTSTGENAAGLVGVNASGTTEITNCTVSAAVHSPTSAGGIVGHGKAATLNMNGCVFNGELTAGNTVGGLVGLSFNGTFRLTNCLFNGTAPVDIIFHPIALKHQSYHRVTCIVTSCYYTADPTVFRGNNMPTTGHMGGRVYAAVQDNCVYKMVDAADGGQYCAPCIISGIEHHYGWEGEAFRPAPSLIDADGTAMTEGTDYTTILMHGNTEADAITEPGDYTLMIAGSGIYSGTAVMPVTVLPDTVTYVDAGGNMLTCESYQTVHPETLSWNNGWYVAAGDVHIIDAVTVTGNVNLLLLDGASLNAERGIVVMDDNSLTIWSQSLDPGTMGRLTAVGGYNSAGIGSTSGTGSTVARSAGPITINGGYIVARGTNSAAGIGTGGTYYAGGYTPGSVITINNGVVIATGGGDGGQSGAGIGGGGHGNAGVITINGGTVVATGGTSNTTDDAPGIGSGTCANGGTVIINGGTVTAISRASEAIGIGRVSLAGTPTAVTEGTLSLPDGYCVTAGTNAGDAVKVLAAQREEACLAGGWVKISLCEHESFEGTVCEYCASDIFAGSGTREDPYRITSETDWRNLGAYTETNETAGVWFNLTGDISVTTMVGSEEHPFCGVFDGNGNTLTVALNSQDQCCAPFSRIRGAAIRSLIVAGTVNGGIHCAGLVGAVRGGSSIENCRVSAAITCSSTHCGGLIGHADKYTTALTGCVFSGSITGPSHAGTFWGWSDDGAKAVITDCLDLSESAFPIGLGIIAEGSSVTNTYYTYPDKGTGSQRPWGSGYRGKLAYPVSGSSVTLVPDGKPGVLLDNTVYAAEGETLTLNLTPAFNDLPAEFIASAGTLAEAEGTWTLAMPAKAVKIGIAFGDADFVLPDDLASIEANAFEGADAAVVYVPDGCAAIGNEAFRNCTNLTRIRIPADCALGEDVFKDCPAVYIYAAAGSPAEAYCADPAHPNCVFIEDVRAE